MSQTVSQIKPNTKISYSTLMKQKCEDNYKGWLDGIDELALRMFFKHLLKESFTDAPKEQYQANTSEDYIKDYLGWLHMCNLVYSEEKQKHIKNPVGRPKISFRTHSSLINKIKSDPNFIWFVPHTFSTRCVYPQISFDKLTGKKISIKGRKEKYVRWINAIFIDIDNLKFETVEELIALFTAVNLPEPTVVHETNSGYHVYWLLDERVPAVKEAKDLYKLIMKNMQEALNTKLPVMDKQVKDLVRYMQVPHNIIYADYSKMVSLSVFQDWVNEHGTDNYIIRREKAKEKAKKTKIEFNQSRNDYSNAEYKEVNERTLSLIDRIYFNPVEKGDRHLACYTLSLFYSLVGYTKEKALETLLKWNAKHGYDKASKPHLSSEVESTVRYVFENNDKNYCNNKWGHMINNLKEVTGEKIVAWNNHVLTREERKKKNGYSHYSEWINDIVTFLCENQIGIINGSQVELADMFEVPLSSFKDIIKLLKEGEFSDLITIEIVGRGRYATTIIKLTAQTVKHFEKESLDHFIASVIYKNEYTIIDTYEEDYNVGIAYLNKASP